MQVIEVTFVTVKRNRKGIKGYDNSFPVILADQLNMDLYLRNEKGNLKETCLLLTFTIWLLFPYRSLIFGCMSG